MIAADCVCARNYKSHEIRKQGPDWLNIIRSLAYSNSFSGELESLLWHVWLIDMHIVFASKINVANVRDRQLWHRWQNSEHIWGKLTEMCLKYAFNGVEREPDSASKPVHLSRLRHKRHFLFADNKTNLSRSKPNDTLPNFELNYQWRYEFR